MFFKLIFVFWGGDDLTFPGPLKIPNFTRLLSGL